MEKYWRLRIFDWKAKSWIFFSKVKNRCLNLKKSKIVIMRWKPMPWRYLQNIIIMSFKNCVENFFYKLFLLVWKVKEFIKGIWTQKYDFFQKITIDVYMSQKYFSSNKKHDISIPLNKFSLWYTWFEYRNDSKIRCGEMSVIRRLL